MSEDYLSLLNEPQREAVTYNEGPSLVIAGAGSGKTRVLTYKIAYLIQQGMNPYQIMALTFTRKAANEMKERIAAVVGEKVAAGIWMGTFHSIFSRILRTDGASLGFSSNFTIYDTSNSESLIKTIVKERKLDTKIYNHKKIMKRISEMKSHQVTPEQYREITDFHYYDMNNHMYEFANIYTAYRNRCIKANAMDYDDILLNTYTLFRNDVKVSFKYQNKFKFVLVDEYQDTNDIQHKIIKHLCRQHQHLCVVGDDAQSIYSFRGADIGNILSFKNDFPTAKLIALNQNYRSTQNIVKVANSLIKKNTRQIEKNVFSAAEEGEKVRVIEHYTDTEEAAVIAREISRQTAYGKETYSDFAILYRANSQSRTLEENLRNAGIPTVVHGGFSFFDRAVIKNVLAYCRLAVNNNDEEALKRIINYPARGIGETTLEKLSSAASSNNASLWQIVCDPALFRVDLPSSMLSKIALFRTCIEQLTKKATEEDSYSAVDFIIKRSGIWDEVCRSVGTEAMVDKQNINELLNGVFQFKTRILEEDDNKDVSLTRYLEEVSLLSAADGDGTNEKGKVTLMTIHASKGLEFKNVYIVGVEEELFPSAMSTATTEGIEEERRLFYVAITRAEKRCTISYAKQRMMKGEFKSCVQSRFIKDIDQELLDLPKTEEIRITREPSKSRWSSSRFAFRTGQQAGPLSRSESQKVGNRTTTTTTTRTSVPSGFRSSVNKSAVDLSKFQPGVFIKHHVYGIGQIAAVEGSGQDVKATIDFNNFGRKKIYLIYVAGKMEIIG